MYRKQIITEKKGNMINGFDENLIFRIRIELLKCCVPRVAINFYIGISDNQNCEKNS